MKNMENTDSVDMPAMPTSLRKMLTVTQDEAGNDLTTTRPTPPSALLSKLDAFLPRMAQANQALSNSATPPAADVVERVSDSCQNPPPALRPASQSHTPDDATSHDSRHSSSPPSNAPQHAVEMDLFVDNSLGQLVPDGTADPPRQQVELVRELPDHPHR